MKLFDLNLI